MMIVALSRVQVTHLEIGSTCFEYRPVLYRLGMLKVGCETGPLNAGTIREYAWLLPELFRKFSF